MLALRLLIVHRGNYLLRSEWKSYSQMIMSLGYVSYCALVFRKVIRHTEHCYLLRPSVGERRKNSRQCKQ